MALKSKILAASCLALVFAGCTSSSLVNLTPSRQPRNENGLYVVEAEWRSNQRSIRYDSITPKVIVGTNTYPMRQTQFLTNRWEAVIPVPKDEKIANYYYKFDFQYSTLPTTKNDSIVSPPYQLEITK